MVDSVEWLFVLQGSRRVLSSHTQCFFFKWLQKRSSFPLCVSASIHHILLGELPGFSLKEAHLGGEDNKCLQRKFPKWLSEIGKRCWKEGIEQYGALVHDMMKYFEIWAFVQKKKNLMKIRCGNEQFGLIFNVNVLHLMETQPATTVLWILAR